MRHREFLARRLDVASFAEDGSPLQGQVQLGELPRWAELLHPDADPSSHTVSWSAQGELRGRRATRTEIWLHLQIQATAALTCQRCLSPVDTPLQVDRWFRFVEDEAQAATLDEETEDDVLVVSKAFDLLDLIEDELLLATPIVPRHDACPAPLSVNEEAAEPPVPHPPEANQSDGAADNAPRPHPFAALAGLKEQLKKGSDEPSS
jgi:uncharacterized protein